MTFKWSKFGHSITLKQALDQNCLKRVFSFSNLFYDSKYGAFKKLKILADTLSIITRLDKRIRV